MDHFTFFFAVILGVAAAWAVYDVLRSKSDDKFGQWTLSIISGVLVLIASSLALHFLMKKSRKDVNVPDDW